MTLLRFRRSTAAWLALIAMALNVAWPLLANAERVDPAAEICSANGVNHAGGGAPLVPHNGQHTSHCTLCPFGAERGAAIAPAAGALLVPVTAPAETFARADVPQVQLALYPAAPPRAPPALS